MSVGLKTSAHAPAARGVALVAVLWMVAALSIMVLGLSHVLKGESRMTGQQQRAALETGLADAAVRLVLVDLQRNRQQEITVPTVRDVQYMGRDIRVEVIPLNGWIHLNQAPPALLANLLVHGARMSADQAQALAQAMVEYRQRPGPNGQSSLFHSVEDLLQMPGMPWEAYLAIAPLLTVDLDSNTQLPNARAAPEGVLHVLAQGRQDVVASILAARKSGDPAGADTTALTAGLYREAFTPRVEIRATLTSGDNTHLVRVWRVALNTSAHGLPWRVLDIQPSLVHNPNPTQNP